jgi:hypothetical protein
MDQAVEIPRDPEDVVESLTEAPNQSSEDLNFADFSPTSKGKPRT